MLVGQHLNLDVTRCLEESLHVDHRVAKGSVGLFACQGDRAQQLRLRVDHSHTTTTPATGRFDDQRVADFSAALEDLCIAIRHCAI